MLRQHKLFLLTKFIYVCLSSLERSDNDLYYTSTRLIAKYEKYKYFILIKIYTINKIWYNFYIFKILESVE